MSKDNKSVKENTTIKQIMTQEELANLMGLSVPTTTHKSTSSDSSLKKIITTRINEVIHETLCKEFGEYYFEIGNTIVQHTKKSGEIISTSVSGYKLVLPKENCKLANGKTSGGFQIGNPTLYCQGLQTQDTIYVIKNGKTIFFKDIVTKDNK